LGDLKGQDASPVDLLKNPLTEQELKVIAALRRLEYGEVKAVVQKSIIVQIVEQKSIKV